MSHARPTVPGDLDLLTAAGGTVRTGDVFTAQHQARSLRDERGVRIPLLLVPRHTFRDGGAAAYARSLRRGLRPQRITRDAGRSPGVVVVDRERRVQCTYVGQRVGDYPPLPVVEAVVHDLLRSAT